MLHGLSIWTVRSAHLSDSWVFLSLYYPGINVHVRANQLDKQTDG